MNTIVGQIDNQRAFQRILRSDSIGVNAQHLTDVQEFVLTLVFDPESQEAVGTLKSLLGWLSSLGFVYGKKEFYEYAATNSLVTEDLQELIDSFWEEPEPEPVRTPVDESTTAPSDEMPVGVARKPFKTPGRGYAGTVPRKKIRRVIYVGALLVVIIAGLIAYRHILDTPDIVARLSNQTILEYIYTHTETHDVKIAAIRNLHDERFLTEIIMKSDPSPLHLEAIANIHDPELLMEICLEYPFTYLGGSAFHDMMATIAQNNLDPDFFVEVAEQTGNFEVRASALPNISDPVIIASYTQPTYEEDVRRQAVELLSDDTLLLGVVNNEDEQEYIRHLAAQRIQDDAILIDLIHNFITQPQDETVLLAMMDNIEDQDYFYQAAMGQIEHEHHRFAVFAAERLHDQEKLEDVAQYAPEWWVREAAIHQITDPEFLQRLAATDSATAIVEAVQERLRELGQ